MKKRVIKTDIVIIGAGIIGCAIARALSRYSKSVLVIDKEADVGWGTTKANSGIIHAGYAGEKNSLKLKLSHKGNKLFRKNAQDLDIPINNIGSMVNAIEKEKIGELERLYKQGKENGIKDIEIIRNKNKIKDLEPNIYDKVNATLFAKDACITSPYEAAIALFENSKENGVSYLFENKVLDIKFEKNFLIGTGQYLIESRFIINAAGVYADIIASMIGDNSFTIQPVKGQYYILDKETFGFVKHTNFPVAKGEKKKSKGILLSPTCDGNTLIGPNYVEAKKGGIATDLKSYIEIKSKAKKYFKNVPFDKTITSFSGLRAVSGTNDFIISPSEVNHKFINVAGIQSPGLTCTFAISDMVIDILIDSEAQFKKNKSFNPIRKGIKRFSQKIVNESISFNKKSNNYANIVCRCEKVSESEVLEAIRRGAKTLDGVKFRTRAGMGRCQGGYCSLRIIKILSRELGMPVENVTKKGNRSSIIKGKIN